MQPLCRAASQGHHLAFSAAPLVPSAFIWSLHILHSCIVLGPGSFQPGCPWGIESKHFCLGEALEATLRKQLLWQSCDLWGKEIERVLRGLCKPPAELRHNPSPMFYPGVPQTHSSLSRRCLLSFWFSHRGWDTSKCSIGRSQLTYRASVTFPFSPLSAQHPMRSHL